MKYGVITFLIINLFLTISCQGQISTLKEFDEQEYICSTINFEEVNLFATFNRSNNQIKIYDANLNLVNTIALNTENYFSLVNIYGLSKDVFNSDGKIEFIIQSLDEKGTNFQLMNEDHQIIKDFGKNSAMIRTIGNKNYIVESKVKYDYAATPVKINQTDKLHLIQGKFKRIIY